MAVQQTAMHHAVPGDRLADILERVLDKGVVIAGDIRIKLVDVELLTIQLRLVICSVDKAKDMGMDWWANSSYFSSQARESELESEAAELKKRIEQLEQKVAMGASAGGA